MYKLNPFTGQLDDVGNSYSPATKVVAPAGSGFVADYYTDGTADDVQIQAAMDMVSGLSGGVIFIRAGTYNISTTLNIQSNIILQGEGANTTLFLINSANVDMFHATDTINGQDNTIIKDLLIDGNKSNQSSKIYGFYIQNSRNITLDNLIVQNCNGQGISFDGSLTARIFITNNIVHDNANCGIGLIDETTQVLIENNQSYSNGQANIAIVGYGSYITIANNFCKHAGYGVTTADNITGYNDLNTHITVTGNQCYDGNNHGIHLAGTHLIVSNNQIDTAQFDGIRIESQHGGSTNCYDAVVSGNTVTNVRNGIYLISLINGSCMGNIVHTCTGTGILTDTTNNVEIANNYSGENSINGIELYIANRSNVIGNTAKNNGNDGIRMHDDGVTASLYNVIAGNNCFDDQVLKTQLYGIRTEGLSDYNFIYGNISLPTDNVTAGILLVGSNSVSFHNPGFDSQRLDGSLTQTIKLNQNPSSGVGASFTLQAGGANGTDQNGGALVLSGGSSVGNNGSTIAFNTTSDSQGSGTTGRDPVEKARITSATNGRFLLGTTITESGIDGYSMGGNVARFLHVNRHPTANTAGNNLSIDAGGTQGGGVSTDKNGGNILLKSGIATGTGSSQIQFQTSKASTTGTGDNALVTKAVLDGNGVLSLVAGAASGTIAKVGGTIFDHYIDTGNTHTDGSTYDDLYSDTLPASLFNSNGDKVTARYSGIFVSSATATRDIKVSFAGTTILDTGALTTAIAESWDISVMLIRVSSTVVRCVATIIVSTSVGASAFNDTTYIEVTSLTLSNTNILKVVGVSGGTGAAASDIVAKLGTVLFQPAA